MKQSDSKNGVGQETLFKLFIIIIQVMFRFHNSLLISEIK